MLARRLIPCAAAVLAIAAAGCDVGDDPDVDRPPQLGTKSDDEEAAQKLGFPSTATRNTIRVGGGDAAADAAGVVGALFPSTSDRRRPPAIVLVDEDDWQGGIAAAALAGPPLGAPALLSDGDELPAVTEQMLERLGPKGSDLSKDAQVIRIGAKPPAPEGLRSTRIEGRDPYALAAAIDRYQAVAAGEPSKDVIVTSGERAEFAMPAAAWAARSGDTVLYTKRDEVPAATVAALRRHERPDIFLLGPESVISKKAEEALGKLGKVRRIQGPTPVANAVEFARYEGGGFGWGIVVPGFNFAVASTARPLDAVAAAPLGSNGVFAPLLLTDQAARVPPALEGYLLDVQPGYEREDPSQAVYNRVWLIGDDRTISIAAQDRIDEVATLVPVEARDP